MGSRQVVMIDILSNFIFMPLHHDLLFKDAIKFRLVVFLITSRRKALGCLPALYIWLMANLLAHEKLRRFQQKMNNIFIQIKKSYCSVAHEFFLDILKFFQSISPAWKRSPKNSFIRLLSGNRGRSTLIFLVWIDSVLRCQTRTNR